MKIERRKLLGWVVIADDGVHYFGKGMIAKCKAMKFAGKRLTPFGEILAAK